MNVRNFFRLSLLLIMALVGALLLTSKPTVGRERIARNGALGVAAPAGTILNDAITGNVPDPDAHVDIAVPVSITLNEVIIQTNAANISNDNDNDSPLTAAEQAALQKAALELPADPTVHVATSRQTPLAPILSSSFEAIDYQETLTKSPPDPEIAVGSNHIIVAVNVAMQIYAKNGTALTAVIPAGSFFGAHPNCNIGGLYDPNVLYDEEAERYLIGFDQGAYSPGGGYCLAVSQTDDPTDSWWLYFFGVNNGSGWLDFPQAGIADNYFVITGNVFDYVPNPNTNFVEAKTWAFAKSQLYAGAAVNIISHGLGSNYFTMQPLHLHGLAQASWPLHGNRIYFLADSFDGANYTLFAWEPGLTPTIVANINLGQAGFPIPALQNDPATIRSNDYRLLDFEYRNGYGWITQTVSCNPGGGTTNCVRWAQIRIVDGSLGPAGVGTYGSSGDFRIFPDLAVNHCNDLVVGYTKSASSSFPGIWYTGRKGSDTAGTLQAESQLKAGEVAYTSFPSDPPPHRWGDYTGMTIDPDGQRFWYIGEYSKNIPVAAKWATYIGSFSYPDCQIVNLTAALHLPIIIRP